MIKRAVLVGIAALAIGCANQQSDGVRNISGVMKDPETPIQAVVKEVRQGPDRSVERAYSQIMGYLDYARENLPHEGADVANDVYVRLERVGVQGLNGFGDEALRALQLLQQEFDAYKLGAGAEGARRAADSLEGLTGYRG
jgi:hypothetical protein